MEKSAVSTLIPPMVPRNRESLNLLYYPYDNELNGCYSKLKFHTIIFQVWISHEEFVTSYNRDFYN